MNNNDKVTVGIKKNKSLIKNVRFDFLREGQIGCIHVEVNCEDLCLI